MKSCCCSCSCCVRMTTRKRKHGAVFPGVFCASGGGVAFVDRGTSTAIACDPASPPCPRPCLGSRSSTAADACAGVDVEGDDSCHDGAGEMDGANISFARATVAAALGRSSSSSCHGMGKGGGLGRCRGCAPTRTARSFLARHRSTLGPEQSSPAREKRKRGTTPAAAGLASACRAGRSTRPSRNKRTR